MKHFTKFLSVIAIMLFTIGVGNILGTTYSHTIGAKTWSAYGAQTLTGVSWTASATGGAFWGYDATKGQQFGSGSSPAKPLSLTTSDISGTITSVKVTTSGASSVEATLSVSVGGTSFTPATTSISATNTAYTFTGSASGAIVITWTQTSSKALYLKALEVTYSAASVPTITFTPTTLSGFTYVQGSGPSTAQTFTVRGANLTNDISIAASTNYEISKTSGSGYTSPLTFTPAQVASDQTVYVRLKAGLTTGTYNSENITASSSGATNQTVTCSGSVTAPAYTITASSNIESYGTVSKSGNVITATPAAGYRVSTTTPYTVTPSGAATVSQSGNNFTVAPTSNCAVQINFEALPTYTLSLSNDGSAYAAGGFPLTTYAGNSATLPTLPNCGGYTFVGWDTNSATTSAPTYAPEATYTTTAANVTLYAVYSKTEGGGSSQTWTATELAEIVPPFSGNSIGTDYDASHAPNQIKLDGTGDYITFTKTGVTLASATINWKMVGGSSTSTLKLQGSIDGSTFSDIAGESYTVSGAQNTIGTATNTANLSSYQAIRWYYTKGSNIGVSVSVTSAASTTTYTTSPGCCADALDLTAVMTASADAVNLNFDGIATATLTVSKSGTDDATAGTWAVSCSNASATSCSIDGTTVTLETATAGSYPVKAVFTPTNSAYCPRSVTTTITVLATPTVTIVDTTPLTFTADCGTESASQTITVNGWNLTTANVTVTVGDNFKVSTDGTTFGSSVTLTKTDGKINNQTVYVRATPATAAEVNYTGTITVSGGGAETNATLDVSVTGACNKIDITFHDNAGLAADAISQIYPGTAIGTLPAAPTVPAEYCAVFDGWSTTPLAVGDSLTSYTKVTTATVFSAATTVYAVYKKTAEGAAAGSGDYELVTANLTDWSGDYLITASTNVWNGSLLGSDLGNADNYVTATIISNSIDGTWGDSYKFTFKEEESGKYSMKSTSGYYIGYNGTATSGGQLSANTSTVYKNTISAATSGNWHIIAESTSKTWTLKWNSDRIKFYNIPDNSIQLYRKATSSSIFTTEAPCGPSVSATLNVTKVTGHKAQYVEVADTLRVNAVRMDGTYNNVKIKVLDNTNFKVKEAGNGGAGGAEQTYTGMAGTDASKKIIVTYTPTTANTTETAQIEVSLYKSVYAESNIISKCTLNVTARALPDTFVVAAKYGEQWVALPNNYGTTMETPKAAYPITVDNATDPTKATLAPTSAFYKAGARNPVNTASQGMRLQRYADGYSLDASDNGSNLALKNIASSEGVTWFLRSDDLKDYQIARNGAEDGRYLTLSGDKIGHYKQPTLVRILPIEVECTRFNSLQNLAEVTKNSSSVELSWDAVDGATAYQYSLDNSTWHDAGTGTSYTVTGLTAGTTVTIYVRVKVASGENCSEVSSITVTIPNCDNAPTVTVTSMTIPENNCGTLKIAYSGLTITTESATCPFTNFGIVYDTVADFSKNPQYLEMGTTTLRAAADTTITVTKAGMYYFGMYAVNEVGRGKTVSQISADVEGLSNLAILLKDNNQTAAMINGKASTRVTYMSESDGAVTWTVKNPSGTEIPNDIAESGYFTGTSMGIYTVSVAQVAAGGYCAATASTYIEVRNPQYFGYITNCAITNNNNIEVIEQDVDSMRVVVDDANVVQIEIVRENSGGGEGGGSQANDLFFSKYFEATGNLKLVGIFNGTGADVDITNVKIGVGAADKSGNTAYSTGASLMNFTNTSTQCIHLGSLGIPNNKILAGQEIIIYTFGGAESNNTSETGTVRLDTCINDELISNTEDHLKMEERDNWYRVESSGAAPIVTGAGICQWSGRQALALWRLSATDTTMLDIFGSYHIDATYGAYAGDSIRASAAFGHEGDAEGWVSPAGTNYLTGATEVIGTNRALLIRKNTVVDGQNAMQLNLDHDFVTLGGPNGEWMGQSVGGGSGSTWLPNSKTCQAFSSVAGFDYADYFQRYEPVTEKITLDGTPNPDGTFTITTDDFAGTSFEGTTFEDLHCNTLKINGYNGDNLVTSLTYKVPIIVKTTMNTDNDSVFNIDKQGKVICPDCDVVIRDAATLTVVPKGYNTLRDVYVYADARLSVPASKTYQMRKLYIQSENNKVGYALVEGTLAANTGIGHTKRIDAQAWYDFTLPYNCKMTDIMRTNGKSLGTYGTDWVIKYYDGAKRAESGTPNGAAPTNWEAVAATGTLQAGVGYVLGLGGWHNDKPAYKVRINLPNVEGQIYTETATSDRQKTVVGHTGTAAQRLPCHQGWNYIGNPFVSRFNRANETPDPWTTDLLLNGYYTDGLTGQTYDPLPDIYVAVQQGENGTTDWVQTTASDALLSPFRAFFVQAVGDGTVDFRKDARDLPAAVMARSVAHDEVVSSFRLTLTGAKTGSNYTELKLHNDYSMAYEVGHDMVRMMNYKVAPEPFILDNQGYYLIYGAVDRTTAEQSVIPLGYYASASDTYTFSLNRQQALDDYEAVYLKDNEQNLTKDLLAGNYTFTSGRARNTSRFTITLQKRQNVVTEVVEVEGDVPSIYAKDDVLIIENLPEGATTRIIDAVGRVLYMTNEHNGTVHFRTPARGAYVIQVMTPEQTYAIKTIL